MKCIHILFAALALAISAHGQVSNPSIITVASDPTGVACTGGLPNEQYQGTMYTCKGGVWTASGGGTPASPTGSIQYNNAGAFGASHLSDNGAAIVSTLPIELTGTPGIVGTPGAVPDLTGTSKGAIYLNSATNQPCYEYNSASCVRITTTADNVGAPVPSVQTTTPVTAAFNTYYYNNATGAITLTLPTPTVNDLGQQICARNFTAKTGAITLNAPSGVSVDLKGATGPGVVSGGALGDQGCVSVASTTLYMFTGLTGTWSLGAGPAFAYDTFVGTASTNLTAHTDNLGNTWTLWTPRGTTSPVLDGAGNITGTGTQDAVYSSATPPSADYTVSSNCRPTGAVTSAFCGVYGRMAVGATSGYGAFQVNGTCTLYVANAGTYTSLGTAACSWANGSTHNIALVLAATSISMQVDGTTVIGPITDATWSAAGNVGLEIGANATTQSMNTFEAR